jgi:hypothetical protein
MWNKEKLDTMKINIGLVLILISLISCDSKKKSDAPDSSLATITGTWKLISGTIIEKGDTSVTDYTQNISFIKIINDTHFAFLQHDMNKDKDSTAVFVAGGGSYSLKDSSYTEHLEYCSAREWEDNDFTFTIDIKNDTLVQKGVEKIESAGVDRINIEKYIRLKK